MKIASLVLISLVYFGQLNTNAQGQLWGTTRRGGSTSGGTIIKANADASNYYEVKKTWTLNTAGASPQTTLLQASNGKIYGVTPTGGMYENGVLFEYSPVSGYVVRWHFKDSNEGSKVFGGLTEASNGKIYGMSTGGTSTFFGTLFEYDPVTFILTPKIKMIPATGTSMFSSMLAASNGKLYGTCQSDGSIGWGVLFEYDPASSTYTVKYNFDQTNGSNPQGALIQGSNGKLYGTTSAGGANGFGVLFQYDISSGIYTKLFDFAAATGKNPSGALVQASNGKLYGLCPGGGANDSGALFEYDLNSSAYNLKQSFTQTDPMGTRPFGGLTQASNGKLYGLTTKAAVIGGYAAVSTVIEFDPATGTTGYKLGATFSNGAGTYNYSSMIASGNSLYGVTPQGGETGSGVLFSYSPLIDTYQKLVDFDYSDEGAFPYAGMTLAGNGKMYGLVSTGGSGKKGLLYEFDPVTETYVKKVEFSGSNGANPLGEMLLASNGKLYGTTTFGGAASNTNYFSIEDGSFNLREGTGFGVLFEYDPVTSTYTKKAEFNLTTGTNPYGELMEASDGFFYGVTNGGGVNNGGTIYKYDNSNGQITKLKDLPANANFVVPGPRSGLTVAPNGKFYGVTPYGINSLGGGIVYEYNPATGDFTILKSFPQVYSSAPNDGNVPMGRLTVAADGKLYGMTSQGGSNSFFGGSIFQVDPAAGQVNIKKILDPSIGIFPKGSFTADGSGKLYAFCNRAGWGNGGAIIQYDPSANSLIKKVEFLPPSANEPDYSTFVLYPGKMGQTIALDAFTPKAYGSGTITLPANSSAGLPITYSSSNPAVATVSGNVVTLVSVGFSDIKGVQAGSIDYNAAPDVIQTLTVNKANQNLIFSAFASHKVSENYLNLYAYVSSYLTPVFTSSDTTIASIKGYTLLLRKVGTVTITASQPGNDKYNAALSADQSLTITVGDQTIAFPAFGTVSANAASFTINANSTSGFPLTFTSSNINVATVSGNKVTVVGAGTSNITAMQGGDANYNPASDVTQTLTVTKLDQTITFSSITSKTLGDAPFSLSASASSLLSVIFTSTSDKITITQNQVTIIKPGAVTIAADQIGNNIYSVAPRVEQTFCIKPAKPSITSSFTNPEAPVLTSSNSAGNQWYLNGKAISGATNNTLTVSQEGSYTVQVTADNCLSVLSDPKGIVTTGLEITPDFSVALHPNPATSSVSLIADEEIIREQVVGVVIYDMLGKQMATGGREMINQDINITSYNAGMYLIKIAIGHQTKVVKFIKH